MIVLAIAIGIFGVGTILSAYTILTRDIRTNYAGTNPASALLELDKVEDSLVKEVRQRPNIADAEAGSWIMSRIEVNPNEWLPLMLFVVNDFNSMRMNKFQPESGAWPPPEGTILLERTGAPLLHIQAGGDIRIQTPNGKKQNITISGFVHDPSLAPSWQEQTAYGYITSSTLASLGESGNMNILKVLVKDQPMNVKSVEATVSDLAAWLNQQGHTVGEIRIPPPGKHPHQSQMTAILIMLLLFSLMALLLSAILTATLIGGMLSGQVRQIGVMKAIGARTRQIASLYLYLVLSLGLVAVILGIPLGIAAGRAFAAVVGGLLNFTIYNQSIPVWVYAVLFFTGVLVPLLTALFPIIRSTSTTVREAINDVGTSRKMFGSTRLDKWLSHIRGLDRTFILAIRNTFRRRGRLLLTLGLLAAAGGMFLSSLNVKEGWERILSDAAAKRHYDLEIRLNHPEQEGKLADILRSVPGIKGVETWNLVPAAANRLDQLNIVRTYPDGGHGSFSLRSAPVDTKIVEFAPLYGHWLEKKNSLDDVVLNHTASALMPGVKVGDSITLNVEGKLIRLHVVGIIRENLSPAAAYISPEAYASFVGPKGESNAFRIVLQDHSKSSSSKVLKEIEQALEKENISVKIVISETMLDEAVSGHVYILIFALIFMSVLMAVVGALGLMSAMGTNVAERTREFGIMRTIGGKSGVVLRNVVSEGVFIGLMSFIVAFLLSLPLSASVGRLIGDLAFRSPLPLILSPTGIVIWLLVIVLGSAAASYYPAWKASRLTIRDTLDYI
ncbi:FtsX-like permease family protein [Paenibacillus apii]|uniref:FtsX-like permease family protein n=1 Tax=Paenibacillus apii TaxID=1850370 RepID=UPI00143B3754|nr:FtsX-like permease family protein [Paenibacillus apii]NJJ39294.1 FtsX-like permease family protein [Paenibacillus apii]